MNRQFKHLKDIIFGTLYFLCLPFNKGIRAILLYHSINDRATFQKQMLYLKKNFRIVLLKDLQKEITKDKIKTNILSLTFDDVEKSIYKNALPILENLGLKATFFITPNWLGKNIDTPFKGRKIVNIQEVKEIFSLGHEIGAHTMNHQKLTEIPLTEARKEIFQSKSYLENLIGSEIVSFAYPYGAFDERIQNLLKEAGFYYGVTTKEALLKDKDIDWFELPRIGIDEEVGMFQFRGKVSLALELYEALRGRR
jgi:peptidoglycan/xylan/chitin deacetylase (PgdA/CDA1 family)